MTTRHELTIEGMTCGHCVRAVEEALRAVPGVRAVEVGLHRASVVVDEGVSLADLVSALEAEEYPARARES